MEHSKEQDELAGVEKIPRAQAEKEIKQAVKHVRTKEKDELQHAAKKAAQPHKGGAAQQDEMADVETIPREQAEQEIKQALKKLKQEEKKS